MEHPVKATDGLKSLCYQETTLKHTF